LPPVHETDSVATHRAGSDRPKSARIAEKAEKITDIGELISSREHKPCEFYF